MFSRVRKIFKEYKELKYLAYHDPLTGLLNRNWLYKNINEINCRYVYFIDINNLRKYNERGHTFGDKHIVKCVNEINIHRGDYLIRYAGDEFILFSNFKNAVKSNELYCVGFSEYNGGHMEYVINLADENMIENKKNSFTVPKR